LIPIIYAQNGGKEQRKKKGIQRGLKSEAE
jgi:hypothetical protein